MLFNPVAFTEMSHGTALIILNRAMLPGISDGSVFCQQNKRIKNITFHVLNMELIIYSVLKYVLDMVLRIFDLPKRNPMINLYNSHWLKTRLLSGTTGQ